MVSTAFIQLCASVEIVWVKETLDLVATFISPPSADTSNEDAVTVRASFCFCSTFMVWDAVPTFITTEAARLSGVVFSFTVMVTLAVPATPLVGATLHQLSALVFMTEALHASLAVKDTLVLPPSVAITGEVLVPGERVTVSCFGFSGFGSGLSGSVFPHEEMINANDSNRSSRRFIVTSFSYGRIRC